MEDRIIDLNCDVGEGIGNDAAILPWVTSANVGCGFHAADPEAIRTTLAIAREHGVVVGAHPSHPDREHFGRRELPRTPAQVIADCIYQIGGLKELARSVAVAVRYVKPHGGLYHQACRDPEYAAAIAAIAEHFQLPVIGLPNSRLADSCYTNGFFAEGFADRRYQLDGTLVPRDQPGALIDDPEEAVEQVDRLVVQYRLRTICVHGDQPRAIDFVRLLREHLQKRGYRIQAFA